MCCNTGVPSTEKQKHARARAESNGRRLQTKIMFLRRSDRKECRLKKSHDAWNEKLQTGAQREGHKHSHTTTEEPEHW
jgi:hypothetical protein